MRLYAGKLLRSGRNAALVNRVETRDAVLYDIDWQTRQCRVKIQGTSTLVTAWVPEGWTAAPAWLKSRNAVIVQHTGGNRGRLEVIGVGHAAPSPVDALDPGFPSTSSPDVILSGLKIRPGSGATWNRVYITSGTYRIGGVTYSSPVITMGDPYRIGDGGSMGYVAGAVTIGTASPSFRYDCIDLGVDGVFHLTAGTDSAAPTKPDVPADHVRVGWVVSRSDMTQIYPSDINSSPVTATVATVTLAASNTDMSWSDTISTLTLTVKDQYGADYPPPGGVWTLLFSIMAGNGTLEDGGVTSTSTLTVTTTTSSKSITYRRDGVSGDSSPIITASLVDATSSAYVAIILRDVSGNPM